MYDSTHTSLEVVKLTETETESQMAVARGWGRAERELAFNGGTVSISQDEKLKKWMMVMAAQQCKCT